MSDLSINAKEFIWEQKFRPAKLAEVIIPQKIKDRLYSYIGDGRIPSMLFASPTPGTGKTTTAYAVAFEIGCKKPMFINASKDTSVDGIREKVLQYASTVSPFENCKQKVVILDECERLSPAAIDSLKGIMEAVSKNCSFILTTNSKQRLPTPIISRCRCIDFIWDKEDSDKLKVQMAMRCCEILDAESIPYDKKAILAVITKFYPDNRSILGALQDYAQQEGKIDINIISSLKGTDIEALIEALKVRNFQQMSQWVMDNLDQIGSDFYGKFFRFVYPDLRMSAQLKRRISDTSVPSLVNIIGEEQKYHMTTPDPYVHLVRTFALIMYESDIKFL